MSNELWFKKLEDDGLLVDSISSLGWGFWPFKADGTTTGYFDERSLRKLADEIERRNKPFWDSYNAACALLPEVDNVDDCFGGDVFGLLEVPVQAVEDMGHESPDAVLHPYEPVDGGRDEQ